MGVKKTGGISLHTARILREYKVTKVFKKFAVAERALFLGSANVMLADGNDGKFKARFCINIPLFHAVKKAFETCISEIKEAIANEQPVPKEILRSYKVFAAVVYKASGAPKLRYTPRTALLLLFAFFSGHFAKVHSALEAGFTDAGKLRNATAHLLVHALESAYPVKPTKSTTRLVAMENASYRVNNMPGCLMEMDTINFRMSTPHGKAHPLLKGLKMLVYFTALGRIEEDLVGPASQSDDEMMRATVIGKALTSGKYNEQLNWPLRFKWRHEEGMELKSLEELEPYVKTDRKISTKCNNIITPFCPEYNNHLNMQCLSGEKIFVNRRMRIGYNGAERFLGIFVKQAWILRHTSGETDRLYVQNVIRIWARLWNLNMSIEDTMYYRLHKWDNVVSNGNDTVSGSISNEIPTEETGGVNYSYLGNHMVYPSSSRIRTKDDNFLPRKEANENILINYFMRVNAGPTTDVCPNAKVQLMAPREEPIPTEFDYADSIFDDLQ